MEDELGMLVLQQQRELKAAKALESDLDLAFKIQRQEALVVSLLPNPSSSSSSSSCSFPPISSSSDVPHHLHLKDEEDEAINPLHLQTLELERFRQESKDRALCESKRRRVAFNLKRRIHDQAFASEIHFWRAKCGDIFEKPIVAAGGHGSASSSSDSAVLETGEPVLFQRAGEHRAGEWAAGVHGGDGDRHLRSARQPAAQDPEAVAGGRVYPGHSGGEGLDRERVPIEEFLPFSLPFPPKHRGADGVLVPAGGFGQRGVEGKILAAKYARENGIPFFGICLGMQIAVIEFTRSILGFKNSYGRHHASWIKEDIFSGSQLQICQVVNPDMIPHLEDAGISFVGKDETGARMEILELPHHPYFVGVQFHPELKSRPGKPSALFLDKCKQSWVLSMYVWLWVAVIEAWRTQQSSKENVEQVFNDILHWLRSWAEQAAAAAPNNLEAPNANGTPTQQEVAT